MSSNVQTDRLPTEEEIEAEINNQTGVFRNIKIAKCERKRFALFGIMFFIIGFIYSFMRILKDLFVMERQDPTCFNFIKIFYILPISFITIVIINYMLQTRSVSKIFSIFMIFFTCLFLFFGSAIILEDSFNISGDSMKEAFSKSNSMVKYFMYTVAEPLATMIYISAELWGTIILSYLYLSYLNEACSIGQNARFIPVLFILISFSLLTSAIVTSIMRYYIDQIKGRQKILMLAGIFFLESGLTFVTLFCKFYLEKNVLSKPIFIPRMIQRPARRRPNTTFKESLSIMKKSKFLLAMCMITFFCSVMINLLETVFKIGVKAGAKDMDIKPSSYSAKLNNFDQYITSIVVILLNLTSFSNLTNTRGWRFVALILPIVSLIGVVSVLGLASYNSAVEDESLSFFNNLFSGDNPMYILENYTGMLVMASLKIFKYIAFDVTKEKISMRIEDRYRPKFKSIYDGLFNKLGKSAGSIYGIAIAGLSSSLNPRSFSPVTGLASLVFIGTWIYFVNYLANSYNESIDENRPVDIDLIDDDSNEAEENTTPAADPKHKLLNQIKLPEIIITK